MIHFTEKATTVFCEGSGVVWASLLHKSPALSSNKLLTTHEITTYLPTSYTG